MDALDKFDPSIGNFENFLTRSIRNRIRDLRRNRARVREDCTLDIAPDDGDTPISQVEDESLSLTGNVEGMVVEVQKKREQRELLSFLVTGTDDITCKVVKLFLAGQPFVAIAKSLGLSDKTVKNKLRYLSRRYDANRFGDQRNYYTV
nr:sigma factor [Brevibacillus brevis]